MLRMRRRGVARAVVGTAVVAGTAGAVHHHQEQRYAQQDAAKQAQYDQQAQYEEAPAPEPQVVYVQAPPAPAPAAAPAGSDMTTKLQELAKLHDQGILTDEEFAAAKQKVLAA